MATRPLLSTWGSPWDGSRSYGRERSCRQPSSLTLRASRKQRDALNTHALHVKGAERPRWPCARKAAFGNPTRAWPPDSHPLRCGIKRKHAGCLLRLKGGFDPCGSGQSAALVRLTPLGQALPSPPTTQGRPGVLGTQARLVYFLSTLSTTNTGGWSASSSRVATTRSVFRPRWIGVARNILRRRSLDA